jgi:hypothetical protein
MGKDSTGKPEKPAMLVGRTFNAQLSTFNIQAKTDNAQRHNILSALES